MVCTPVYAEKANAGMGGTGYEKQIVKGEMLQGASSSKFIPLLRKGSQKDALPSFLKSKYYIDFRKDAEFGAKLKDLLHQLHKVPKYSRPSLGQSPFSLFKKPKQSMPELPPPLDMILNPRTKPRPAPEAGITTVSSEHRVHQEAVIIQPESFKKYRASLISGQDLTVQVG